MTAEAVLLASLDEAVLTLTLNRPNKRNALGASLVAALHDALERADLDPAVRVVAIRGAGKDFCAGADLDELLASADRSSEENERDALRLGAVFQRIRTLVRPVVALVQGRALAGGAGLAIACDVVIAAEGAQFGFPEIQRGFVPAMVLALLRRTVGEKTAFDLATTGRVVGAEEAASLGLVTLVVPAAEFTREAGRSLQALTASSASALALTKRLFYELDGLSFDAAIALGARVNALARTTPDFRAAVEGFLRKGPD